MILYLDCANGVSGDMLVAALLDLLAARGEASAHEELLQPALIAVGVEPALVTSPAVRRGGFVARSFTVADSAGFATFRELIAIVRASSLAPAVQAAVVVVAERMAAAETAVHGRDDPHLHELSGIDTIVDLVSCAVLVDHLAPERVVASPPALGSGAVMTTHGRVAVPAPAVAQLLIGTPVSGGGDGAPLGELTTPTGAALLTTFAASFGALPAGRLSAVGYGAGQREIDRRPNLLRALLLDPAAAPSEHDDFEVLETNIDDMTPELLAHAAERLRAAGAVDVWLTPALMKKARPGAVLHVLARARQSEALAEVVFAETSSFGLRRIRVERSYAVERRVEVTIDGQQIAVRLAYAAGRLVTVSPEFADVRRAAEILERGAERVREAAQAAVWADPAGAAAVAPVQPPGWAELGRSE